MLNIMLIVLMFYALITNIIRFFAIANHIELLQCDKGVDKKRYSVVCRMQAC